MFAKERELVELGSHSYNLKEGGSGGFDYINDGSQAHLSRCRRAGQKGGKTCGHFLYENGLGFFRPKSKEEKTAIALKAIRCLEEKRPNHYKVIQEKSRSSESIEKRRSTFQEIGHQQGEKNSQFGTMWITNGQANRKVKKNDTILDGWTKGRKV